MEIKRERVLVDMASKSRCFEGIGGVTSNGMSRLLYDYPVDIREEILDLLFKPKYGASLHALKVEIGSDANGTGGTEPSHMRSVSDFDITRGVGLSMARSAKDRNPEIILDAIRWGTPSWITDNDKKYKYYYNFLKGAKDVFDLDFDYLAPDENEGDYDVDWVVNVLRPRLDRDGFASVKLSGADSTEDWNIVPLVDGNEDLKKSIDVLNRHYKQDTPLLAKEFSIPIFNSEDLAPFRNKFCFALDMAYKIIRSYASGKMTQYIMHPVIESMYDSVPYSYKGILAATSPWSSGYEICPGLWITAHFTQFISPGWLFIDSGCKYSDDISSLSLVNPITDDISIILLNRSEYDIEYQIELRGTSIQLLHAWYTTESEQFINIDDIEVVDGIVNISLMPNSIYTLTTTTGQKKASEKLHDIPQQPLHLPYKDDFNCYKIGKQPKYAVDQGGAFEISDGGKDNSQCLRQILPLSQKPFDWERRPTPLPYTILGCQEWTNYKASVDFYMEEMDKDFPGYILFAVRCNFSPAKMNIPESYNIRIFHDGRWVLAVGADIIKAGKLTNFSICSWHNVAIICNRYKISTYFDNALLSEIVDTEIFSGNIVLGSNYNLVRYDNLIIDSLDDISYSCMRYSVLDSRVIKIGDWREVGSNPDNYFRTLIHSDISKAMLRFKFYGSEFSIIGPKDENYDSADVFVDKEFVGKASGLYASKRPRRSLFSLYDLEKGVHEVEIVLSSKTNFYVNAIELNGELIL